MSKAIAFPVHRQSDIYKTHGALALQPMYDQSPKVKTTHTCKITKFPVQNPISKTVKPLKKPNQYHLIHQRWYDPQTRRFISGDPALINPARNKFPKNDERIQPMDFHPYQFVRNNPIRFRDPMGEDITIIDWNVANNPSSAYPHTGLLIDVYDDTGDLKGQEFYDLQPSFDLNRNIALQFFKAVTWKVEGVIEGPKPTPKGGTRTVLKTTKKQDKKAIEYIKSVQPQKIPYNLFGPGSVRGTDNCASFANKVLKQAGVSRTQLNIQPKTCTSEESKLNFDKTASGP